MGGYDKECGQAFHFCCSSPRKSRLICPTGCPANFVSSAISKNISLHRLVETALLIPPSHPTQGAYRDRHERGVRMRWTRQRFARDGIAGRVL
jgi:hypothetical protein